MGEVIEVASGYARNYLIPRGMAVGVTRGTVKDIAEQKKVLEVKAARQREQLQGVAEKVAAKPLVIKARCSASGKLFGSITNRQLASAIEEATGEEIDRHKIHVDDRIRSVGNYKALIKLHPDVEIEVDFEVEGEGFEPEEPEGESEAEAAATIADVPAEQAPAAGEESGSETADAAPADEMPPAEQG
jgi:large subunit ribosomal protein L9